MNSKSELTISSEEKLFDVFFVYNINSKTRIWVRNVVHALKQESIGFRCGCVEYDYSAQTGDSPLAVITRCLIGSRKVIAVIDDKVSQCAWTEYQIDLAHILHVEKRLTLIPVLLGVCEMPVVSKTIEVLDVSTGTGTWWPRLLSSLGCQDNIPDNLDEYTKIPADCTYYHLIPEAEGVTKYTMMRKNVQKLHLETELLLSEFNLESDARKELHGLMKMFSSEIRVFVFGSQRSEINLKELNQCLKPGNYVAEPGRQSDIVVIPFHGSSEDENIAKLQSEIEKLGFCKRQNVVLVNLSRLTNGEKPNESAPHLSENGITPMDGKSISSDKLLNCVLNKIKERLLSCLEMMKIALDKHTQLPNIFPEKEITKRLRALLFSVWDEQEALQVINQNVRFCSYELAFHERRQHVEEINQCEICNRLHNMADSVCLYADEKLRGVLKSSGNGCVPLHGETFHDRFKDDVFIQILDNIPVDKQNEHPFSMVKLDTTKPNGDKIQMSACCAGRDQSNLCTGEARILKNLQEALIKSILVIIQKGFEDCLRQEAQQWRKEVSCLHWDISKLLRMEEADVEAVEAIPNSVSRGKAGAFKMPQVYIHTLKSDSCLNVDKCLQGFDRKFSHLLGQYMLEGKPRSDVENTVKSLKCDVNVMILGDMASSITKDHIAKDNREQDISLNIVDLNQCNETQLSDGQVFVVIPFYHELDSQNVMAVRRLLDQCLPRTVDELVLVQMHIRNGHDDPFLPVENTIGNTLFERMDGEMPAKLRKATGDIFDTSKENPKITVCASIHQIATAINKSLAGKVESVFVQMVETLSRVKKIDINRMFSQEERILELLETRMFSEIKEVITGVSQSVLNGSTEAFHEVNSDEKLKMFHKESKHTTAFAQCTLCRTLYAVCARLSENITETVRSVLTMDFVERYLRATTSALLHTGIHDNILTSFLKIFGSVHKPEEYRQQLFGRYKYRTPCEAETKSSSPDHREYIEFTLRYYLTELALEVKAGTLQSVRKHLKISKTEWMELVHTLHWQISRKAPSPQSSKVDKEQYAAICADVKRVIGVFGYGYFKDKFRVDVEESVFQEREVEIRRRINTIENKHKVEITISPSTKIPLCLMPGSAISSGYGRRGTLGCFAERRLHNSRDKTTCAIVPDHIKVGDGDVYAVLQNEHKLPLGKFVTSRPSGWTDINAIELNKGFDCRINTQFRDEKGNVCKNVKVLEHTDEENTHLVGRNVHFWGASSKPGKGIICSDSYVLSGVEESASNTREENAFLPQTCILISDDIDVNGQPFAKEGDSGAIILMESSNDEDTVYAVSMVLGSLADSASKLYFAVRLTDGLRSLEERSDSNYEILFVK